MTTPQRVKLMAELWPNACAVQGWNEKDREKRLDVINDILAQHPRPERRRAVSSTNDLDSDTDYTLVKTRLLMLADNLKAAGEDGKLIPNAIRTRREVIRRQVKCLALYLVAPTAVRQDSRRLAQKYALEIIRDAANRAGYEPVCFEEAKFEKVLCALEFPALDRLVKTLNNRLHFKGTKTREPGYRVRAGHTLHDMLTGAGLRCACKQCCLRRAPAPVEEPVPAGIEEYDPDWTV